MRKWVSLICLLMIVIQSGIGYEQATPTMNVGDAVYLCATTDSTAGFRNRAKYDKYEVDLGVSRREDLQEQVSLIGKKQDPFECIAGKTRFFSVSEQRKNEILWELAANPIYQQLVRDCQSVYQLKACNASYPYRSFDGTCNNLGNPFWGSPLQCLIRLMPAQYDGTSGFRKSVKGGSLPTPRKLSLNLSPDIDTPLYTVSNAFAFFGQILTHDIILTSISSHMGQIIECCPPQKDNHPQCAPIILEKNDPFFSQFNKTCINFQRNAKCATCQIGKRNQMPEVTAFIDGSVVYSNSETSASQLRTNDGTGKLKVQDSHCGPLLPKIERACGSIEKGEYCFKSGDTRVNQHSQLMMYQTVFMRLHNILAEKLKEVNLLWEDEKLFQEARRLLGAILQNIVYGEFLPLLLGEESMNRYGLYVNEHGRTFYDPHIDPTIFNEFNTVAFRAHSLTGAFVEGYTRMQDTYLNASLLYDGRIGTTLGSMTLTHAHAFNSFLVSDITNKLVRKRNCPYGQDLFAIDVHRGRDHGIPPYIRLVEFCTNGAIKIERFSDLYSVMDEENIQALQRNFKDVNDIDAWIGILLERKNNQSGIVGPTPNCIIAKQFFHLKFGDRFYFEHEYWNTGFSDDQLQEIRNVLMSKVLCDTTDVTKISKYAFMLPFQSNPTVSCSDFPDINFNFWKES